MPNELNYTIDFLSYEWIRNNLVAFIIILSLIYIAKKNTRNYKFSLLFPYFIGSFLLFRVFAIQWYHYKIGIWDIAISLPFHLCSYSSILSGVTLLIANNKKINAIPIIDPNVKFLKITLKSSFAKKLNEKVRIIIAIIPYDAGVCFERKLNIIIVGTYIKSKNFLFTIA